MGTNALAILHIHPDTVRAAIEASQGGESAPAEKGFGTLTGADDNPYRVRFFEDATAVYLGVPLGFGDPDVMGTLVATALGDLMDEHDDPRGVPLIPESYEPKSTTWTALVDELGEAADWVPIDSPEVIDPMQGLLGAFGGQGPDLMSLAAQMQGQDPAALMQQAMQMAQQLAASGGLGPMQQMLEQMMQQGPQLGVIDAEFEDQSGSAGTPSSGEGLDLEEITRQAERMLDANPVLKQQLLAQFGGLVKGGGDDDKNK